MNRAPHLLSSTAPLQPLLAAVDASSCERDLPGVLMPCAETHLVVRQGPSARGGLDAHVIGGRPRAHRKVLRAGQRTLSAKLRLGAHQAVFGVPAAALFDRIVPLEALWGAAATGRLLERLAAARTSEGVGLLFEAAIAERLATDGGLGRDGLALLTVAEKLQRAPVRAVADDLEFKERSFRRAFRRAVGMSPKAYAKLARFERAVRAARADVSAGWASIAAQTGYYDQAHLIADFRALAGTTPGALLAELQAASSATR